MISRRLAPTSSSPSTRQKRTRLAHLTGEEDPYRTHIAPYSHLAPWTLSPTGGVSLVARSPCPWISLSTPDLAPMGETKDVFSGFLSSSCGQAQQTGWSGKGREAASLRASTQLTNQSPAQEHVGWWIEGSPRALARLSSLNLNPIRILIGCVIWDKLLNLSVRCNT